MNFKNILKMVSKGVRPLCRMNSIRKVRSSVSMIEYYEQLMQEEQEALTDVIQLLYRQTFLLERKYDRRAGRLAYVKEYRICSTHLEFL